MDTAHSQLDSNGFAKLGAILPQHEATSLFQAFQDHLGPTPQANEYGLLRNDVWRQVPLFQQELLNGPLGDLAATLMQVDEVILFQDNVIKKPPHHY